MNLGIPELDDGVVRDNEALNLGITNASGGRVVSPSTSGGRSVVTATPAERRSVISARSRRRSPGSRSAWAVGWSRSLHSRSIGDERASAGSPAKPEQGPPAPAAGLVVGRPSIGGAEDAA